MFQAVNSTKFHSFVDCLLVGWFLVWLFFWVALDFAVLEDVRGDFEMRVPSKVKD